MSSSPQCVRLASALAFSLILLCNGPARAQNAEPVTVSDPAPLDPNSPMADLPDLGVAWPDMSESLGEGPEAVAETTKSESGERRYSIELDGLEKLGAVPVKERFDALSVLKQGQKDPANTAQIDRRTREDRDLLEAIMRTSGYYDAQVEATVENGGGDTLVVRFAINPGPLYRFDTVAVTGLEDAGAKAPAFDATFGVEAEDAIDADDVVSGRAALEKSLKDSGFPFAKVNEPEVVVDHETRTGTLAMAVETGGERRFGDIRIKSLDPPFNAKHVATIARFKTGEPYDQSRIDDLKRALVATGIVGGVDLQPVPGTAPGTADIEVGLEKAPLRTIAGEAGYGTGEGIRAEISWTHRNLIKPEGAVTLRGVAGTREQLAGVVLRQSNFHARDRVLNARLLASNINRRAFEARTVELAANLERQSNIIWQKRWTWSGGAELIATDERDMTAGIGRRQTFLIAAAPLSIGYDRSDNLLDPTKGFRLGARVSPELSLRKGTMTYVRMQLDASAYAPLGKSLVLAGRIRAGTIMGSSNLALAPSRRFYAGGGGSVRGYGYQEIGPRDAFNDPVGGRSLTEFSLEARIRFGVFGVVPFIDGGNIYTDKLPKLSGFRYGAGVGLRYHSSFGPIRIDVGTPINPRKGDTPVTVFVSLGQAF